MMWLWIFFFLSGLAGLVYEILWVRELVLVFGATTFAVATVLTAFMGGLALGSHLMGRHSDRMNHPLRIYGLFEIGIGIYALLIHSLFDALIPIYRLLWSGFNPSFYTFSLFRFALISVILLVPTTLMGGTLPLLATYAARRHREQGKVITQIGALYAVNIAGAVLGVLAAGFILLPELGSYRTTLMVATLNVLVGMGALGLSRQTEAVTERSVFKPDRPIRSSRTPNHRLLLFAFALSGLAAMVYQVAWTRLLTQMLGSTIYSFALLLATFLLGLSLGSACFSLFSRRIRDPIVGLAMLQCGIGLMALAGAYLFGKLPSLFLGLINLLHSIQLLLPAAKFLLTASVMLPATFLMGAVFPVILRALIPETDRAGREVGRAYAWNTLGTIVGSFLGGFVLLPFLGMQSSILLAVAVNIALGILLLHVGATAFPARGWITGGSLALLTVGLLAGPRWDPLSLSSEIFGKSQSMELLFYQEGLNATVTVAEHPTLEAVPHLTLAIDGKANASTSGDMPTQILVGQIPLLLASDPKTALVVGLGSGITVGSVAQHPLEEIVAVELEPAVVQASRYFNNVNNRPLEDPRVRLLEDDARNYLLVNPRRFDVIISEPSHPWRSGSAKLFTREFFELGRSHLNPKGVFAQWIHFYGIKPPELKGVVRTFHAVFPEILMFYTPAGDLMLMGSTEPFNIDLEEIGRKMATPRIGFELSRIKVHSVYDLFAYFILGTREVEAYVGDGPLNTDDDTFVEFQTPKSLFEDTLAIHLTEMGRHASLVSRLLLKEGTKTGIIQTAGQINPPNRGRSRIADGSGSDRDRLSELEAQMAEAYQKNGRLEDAENAIRRALGHRPSASGYHRLALILQERGRDADALGAWVSGLAQDPRHRDTLIHLTRREHERGNLPAMGRYLDRWALHHPQDPLLPYYQGIRRYYDGDPEAALKTWERLGSRGGPLAEYYRSLAHVRLGQDDAAQAALSRFLEGLNRQRKQLEEHPKRFNTLPILRSKRLREQERKTIPEEERLYQLFDRIVGKPLHHIYGGMGLYMIGYFREAAVEFETGLNLLGERRHGSLGQFYLGMAYQRLGKDREAIEALKAFLDGGGDGGFRMAKAQRAIETLRTR